jgi:hypothetical protein
VRLRALIAPFAVTELWLINPIKRFPEEASEGGWSAPSPVPVAIEKGKDRGDDAVDHDSIDGSAQRPKAPPVRMSIVLNYSVDARIWSATVCRQLLALLGRALSKILKKPTESPVRHDVNHFYQKLQRVSFFVEIEQGPGPRADGCGGPAGNVELAVRRAVHLKTI